MKSNTVTIKNELPHLLEAVMNHSDCGQQLRDAILDAVEANDRRLSFLAFYDGKHFDSVSVLWLDETVITVGGVQ